MVFSFMYNRCLERQNGKLLERRPRREVTSILNPEILKCEENDMVMEETCDQLQQHRNK